MLSLRERFNRVSTATQTAILVDLQAVNPKIAQIHFQYGPTLAVLKELVKLSNNSQADQYKMFPLIAVLEDNPQRTIQGKLSVVTPRIIFCYRTDTESNRVQREDNSFAPILWPMVSEFTRQTRKTGMFNTFYQRLGTTTEHPFWGTEALYGHDGLIFNTPLDCIEISGREFLVRETNACSQALTTL